MLLLETALAYGGVIFTAYSAPTMKVAFEDMCFIQKIANFACQ